MNGPDSGPPDSPLRKIASIFLTYSFQTCRVYYFNVLNSAVWLTEQIRKRKKKKKSMMNYGYYFLTHGLTASSNLFDFYQL